MLIVRLCVFCDDLCLIELIVVLIRLSVKQSKGKKVKDPNKPKRAPSAFFVFMYVFLIFCISVFIWLLSVLVLDPLLCRRIYLCNICVCVFDFCREGFRKQFKEENPNVKGVAAVSCHFILVKVCGDFCFYFCMRN